MSFVSPGKARPGSLGQGRDPSTIVAGLVILSLLAGIGWLYWRTGLFGINSLLARGATVWATVGRDDGRLSPSMRLALADSIPEVTPGKVEWRELAPGLETAELAVLAAGKEVDSVLLTRIDPQRYRFRVMTAPAGRTDLDGWLASTKAVAIINGSFHGSSGQPDTPVMSDGRQLGPLSYTASHGVLVAGDSSAGLRDLVAEPWQKAVAGATQAMVSFPLLITSDGTTRTQRADRRWLANRSFVGQDGQGRLVLGTTKDAFFSLDRLAAFLREAPLGLRLALNLNGGQMACQGVQVDKVVRSFCGSWETRVQNDQLRLQGQLFGSGRRALPIVLAAFPR
jgi:hypothetical protein